MGFWILFILIVLFLLTVPWWRYNRHWSYWLSGILLAMLIGWTGMIWTGTADFEWPWAAPVPVRPPPGHATPPPAAAPAPR